MRNASVRNIEAIPPSFVSQIYNMSTAISIDDGVRTSLHALIRNDTQENEWPILLQPILSLTISPLEQKFTQECLITEPSSDKSFRINSLVAFLGPPIKPDSHRMLASYTISARLRQR